MRRLVPLPLLLAALLVRAQDAPRAAGRALYATEACWQCHVHGGDPGFPPVAGTRRTGPVLGARPFRSAEWHRALLHDPRAVLPESQMPAYRHLFRGHEEAAAVAAFVERFDSPDGSMDQDGIVARAELGDGDDWPDALDRDQNGVISAADAPPVPSPAAAALIRFITPPPPAAPAPPPAASRRPALDPAAAIERGGRLYARHCAGCHGARGNGNGPAARFFGLHPPRNFLRGEYRYRSTPTPQPPLDEDLFRTIRRGAGPSMPAWPHLSDAQVWDLVELLKSHHPAYVPRELFVEKGGEVVAAFTRTSEAEDASGLRIGAGRVVKRAGAWWWNEDGRERRIEDGFSAHGHVFRIGREVYDWMADLEPERLPLPEPTVAYTRTSARIGAKVYEEFGCASCHGEKGRGDGPAAVQTRGSLGQIVRPTDYTHGAVWLKGGADARSLVRSFLTGLHGTPMPAYRGNFASARSAPPEDASWHLAHYVMRQAGIPFDR